MIFIYMLIIYFVISSFMAAKALWEDKNYPLRAVDVMVMILLGPLLFMIMYFKIVRRNAWKRRV